MVAGFNLFSFDLFGFGRRALGQKREDAVQLTPDIVNSSEEVEKTETDDDQEREIFLWSLYLVF